jgi:hypothetical protein
VLGPDIGFYEFNIFEYGLVMIEYIKGILYTCGCGYKTTNSHAACQHSKTQKCQAEKMHKKNVEFVLKEDHLETIRG